MLRPSAFVKEGDTVLDLASGGGKICYIASQIVGEKGKVIGVDTNLEMLEPAEKYREGIAATIGYANVEFRYGRIQDLKLDMKHVDRESERPISAGRDIPTGGVSLKTAADFIKAGASALGVGTDFVDVKAIREGNPEIVTERARQFVEIVRGARAA